MIYDFFRWVGIITGYPVQLLFFKRKVFYENADGNAQGRKIKGGALVVSNHYNVLDYVSNVFLFVPRKLFVVASELAFRNRLIAFGMRFWGGIEANRDTKNMGFVKKSAELLRKGKLVQIFPEGRNSDDGKLGPFYPSYITIALRGAAPIVPVVSDGNYGLFKRLHVIIGEPIDLGEYLTMATDGKYTRDDVDYLNELVRNKVVELRDELERRVNSKGD